LPPEGVESGPCLVPGTVEFGASGIVYAFIAVGSFLSIIEHDAAGHASARQSGSLKTELPLALSDAVSALRAIALGQRCWKHVD